MPLGVVKTVEMRLPEVSGLGFRKGAGGSLELLVLGDRTFQVGFSPWGSGEVSFELRDVSSLCPGTKRGDSQFEAIAGDASGRVFVLQESPGAVFVFSPELDRLLHTIELHVPDDNPVADDWNRDLNSRGEGMVLLRSGHVLLLKEKKPSMLIEFGPEGAAARGYERGLAVGADAEFALPQGASSRFVPLAAWRLSKSDQKLVGDLSDLAVDRRGRLFALSDQERLLVRLESTLTPDETSCAVKHTWELPSALDKPEGLVITERGEPIVACDTTKKKGHAYVLDPIEGTTN